jgi:ABC-type dipeptide/oligopeptide/nickel transport system permease component
MARRLLGVIPTLLSVFVLTFALVHALPGDPAQTLAGEGADPARVEEIRRQYGFDRPLPAQFVTYVSKVSRGKLGVSTASASRLRR